jgi:hypothetical protein
MPKVETTKDERLIRQLEKEQREVGSAFVAAVKELGPLADGSRSAKSLGASPSAGTPPRPGAGKGGTP